MQLFFPTKSWKNHPQKLARNTQFFFTHNCPNQLYIKLGQWRSRKLSDRLLSKNIFRPKIKEAFWSFCPKMINLKSTYLGKKKIIFMWNICTLKKKRKIEVFLHDIYNLRLINSFDDHILLISPCVHISGKLLFPKNCHWKNSRYSTRDQWFRPFVYYRLISE